MKNICVFLIPLILSCFLINHLFSSENDEVSFTILYDNYVVNENVKADWGFSCFIKGTEKTILFDTGTRSEILFHNINQLNVDIKEVEYIVISHDHGDHTGGLFPVLKKNNKVSVYLPASFYSKYVKKIENMEAQAVSIEDPVEICKDVYLTGEMGSMIKEQSLILNTDKGLVIVTGCSHQGIVNILKKAKEMFDKKIYLVFGGFHLMRTPKDQVREIIKTFRDMGVCKVGATHCTGVAQIEMFKKEYGEDFMKIGVGKVITIK